MIKINPNHRRQIVKQVIDHVLNSITIYTLSSKLNIDRKQIYRLKSGSNPSYYYTLLFMILWDHVGNVTGYHDTLQAIDYFLLDDRYYELKTEGSAVRKEQTLETFL